MHILLRTRNFLFQRTTNTGTNTLFAHTENGDRCFAVYPINNIPLCKNKAYSVLCFCITFQRNTVPTPRRRCCHAVQDSNTLLCPHEVHEDPLTSSSHQIIPLRSFIQTLSHRFQRQNFNLQHVRKMEAPYLAAEKYHTSRMHKSRERGRQVD